MVTPLSPDLALALGVMANPGVYALLVGSGISRSAKIPTGWELVLDLVRRLAKAESADPGPDPAAWYRSRYGEPPRYSALLERLGPRAADRQSLLRGYFEPSDQERAEGIKSPTAAHHAIADLVAGGLIRVVVTTNFDRLIESALESAGIVPNVIATSDQAAGAPPLAHSRCTVIKLHGDYLDTRIRNSDDELARYDARIDALIDQVLDEYGLIVCGWSGEYDVALRAAFDRCPSKRYATYWCVRGDRSVVTDGLIACRNAQVVEISDADSFFTQLVERVNAIRETGERHPPEARVAAETLKRYLSEDRYRIRLRELVGNVTEELVGRIGGDAFPPHTAFSNEELLARTRRLEIACESSLALIANGCYWGEAKHDDLWLQTIRRLAEFEAPRSGLPLWIGLFRYPALLHLYVAGIASVAASRYYLLAKLLHAPCRSIDHGEIQNVVESVYAPFIVSDNAAQILMSDPDAPETRYKTPLSQYLFSVLRPVFTELVPAEQEYTDAFDRFEYLVSLVQYDLDQFYALGCFVWRDRRQFFAMVGKEIEAARDRWPPLSAGLFGGSLDRLLEAKQAVDAEAARRRWR